MQITSPPIPFFLACRSLITPAEVDIIDTPRPPSTFGNSSLFRRREPDSDGGFSWEKLDIVDELKNI